MITAGRRGRGDRAIRPGPAKGRRPHRRRTTAQAIQPWSRCPTNAPDDDGDPSANTVPVIIARPRRKQNQAISMRPSTHSRPSSTSPYSADRMEASKLNVAFRDRPCSWRTRAQPPLRGHGIRVRTSRPYRSMIGAAWRGAPGHRCRQVISTPIWGRRAASRKACSQGSPGSRARAAQARRPAGPAA